MMALTGGALATPMALSTSDSVTIAVNGGTPVKILTYSQEATMALGATGKPTGLKVAGIFSFTKKFYPNVSVT